MLWFFMLKRITGIRPWLWKKLKEFRDSIGYKNNTYFKLLWYVVLGIFSWHTLGTLVSIKDCLNAATDLGAVSDQIYDYGASILWGLFLTDHRMVTKMKNKGRVASTVIESHSSTAPLGCGANIKKMNPGRAANQSRKIVRCHNKSKTSSNTYQDESVLKAKQVQPGTRIV